MSVPGTIRSSHIVDIIQDNLGLIWIAGDDALYRYDGFRFKRYRELKDGGIFSFHEVHQLLNDTVAGRILIATYDHGIVAYDYGTEHLTQLPSAEQKTFITMLAQTADGKIWAGSTNYGLFSLQQDTLRRAGTQGEAYSRPFCLLAAGKKLFIGVRGGILIYENGQVTERIELAQEKNLPASTLPSTMFISRDKKLWIGTENQGVLVYDLISKKFTRHFPPTRSPFFNKISRIYQDKEDFIWILTRSTGLVIHHPQTDSMIHLMRDPFSLQSLSSDNCFSLLEDRDGIMWIGATGDINILDRNQVKFSHYYHNPANRISLTDNVVRGVYEDNDGQLWIGTDGGYINRIDLRDQTCEYIKVSLPGDNSNYIPMYFQELNKHLVLIATPVGLLQFDKRSKTFSTYAPLWSVTKDKNVRQLLLTGHTLYFILNNKLFVHDLLTLQTEMADKKEVKYVTALCLDDQQRLWVGSRQGISLFNPADKTFQLMPFDGLPVPTNGVMVLSLQQAGNRLYAGTFNAGLLEIDISDPRSIPRPGIYVDRPGLTSNTIYASLPDNQGNLWLSTNSGLVRFTPRTGQFLAFSMGEGLQGEEFNRLAYAKMRDGKIVFGGVNGINVFHPDEIHLTKENFRPSILSVSANNPLAPERSTRLIHPEKPLSLSHDQNFVNVHFFVPCYKNPRRYSLYYKLENFEEDWKDGSRDNVAAYANLQPGSYTFLLKAVSINGQEKIVRMPFSISAPYWKSGWFILLAVCTVALMVITIIRSYLQKAENDRERLQQLLKIRTSEIERSREELRILNEKKDLIFSILSHDLRSPLTTLKGFLGYLIDHAEELTTEELKKHAVNIKNSVTNSLDLIDNTLFWSLSQMGTIQYTPAHFPLQPLLEKLKGLYQLTADKKRIPLTIQCAEPLILNGDENMIYVALRNLVSNALKFSTQGNPVLICCKRKENFAEIQVVDKGIGMSPEYIRKILSMDQPMIKKGTSNEKGTGVGLLLCKKFVEMNQGHLSIHSTEDVGTTFTVLLPLAITEPSEKRIIP